MRVPIQVNLRRTRPLALGRVHAGKGRAVTDERPTAGSQPRWIGDLWIFAAITLAFFGLSRWQYRGHQRFVEVNRGEVVYSRTASKQTAIKLGRALRDIGTFAGKRRVTVGLGFSEGRHELKLIIDKAVIEGMKTKDGQDLPGLVQLKQQLTALCREAFGEAPAVVRLTDAELIPHTDLLFLP